MALSHECSTALRQNDVNLAQNLASQILGIGAEAHDEGSLWIDQSLRCLNAALGVEWVHDPIQGKFTSAEEREATERTLREERSALLDRKCRIEADIFELERVEASLLQGLEFLQGQNQGNALAETITECSSWFLEDRRAAMTNDICSTIFLERGLPNSPNFEEILELSRSLTEAQTDLSKMQLDRTSASVDLMIIDTQGVFPDDYERPEIEGTWTAGQVYQECLEES